MKIENKPLVLDLVEWIASKPRTHADVMDAWRTSCPRLPIWEDAVDLGLVACRPGVNAKTMVAVTAAGWALLQRERPRSGALSQTAAAS